MMMDVYMKFYKDLVMVLPMDDVTFTASLYSLHLLPGDMKDQLKLMSTSKEKATHFLDNVIAPAVAVDNTKVFQSLLAAMEDYGSTVAKLAKDIKSNFMFINQAYAVCIDLGWQLLYYFVNKSIVMTIT